ncbi:MAG: S8 family peptidase [Betaproteobacteria bacterium]
MVAATALADTEFNPAYVSRNPGPFADSARVIVKFKNGSALVRKSTLTDSASAVDTFAVLNARAESLGNRLGLKLVAGRALDERSQVMRASGMSSAELAARLAAEPDVEYAVVDQRRTHYAVPDDPLYAQGPAVSGTSGGPVVGQWYLRAPAGEVISSINATGAWDVTTGSPNIVVAVLDTGVRPEHPDLAGRLLPGYDMLSDAAEAGDGDARDTDATDNGDFVTAAQNEDQSGSLWGCGVQNSSWHGTKTTSLIGAASNNGIGMAGVAWHVLLLPVRVLGKCGGSDSDIIAGMKWAAGLPVPGLPLNPNPARVLNMSLGAAGSCLASYVDAVAALGSKPNPAIVVAAAGNSAGHAVGAPANCPGVVAVSALRHAGTKVGFSDLGAEITVSAPGGNCVNTGSSVPCLYPILAATNTGATTPASASYSGSFSPSVGTSFSAPLVAGTVALMLSVKPELTPADIRATLKNTARPFLARPAASTIPVCHAPDGADQLECYCTTSTCGGGMLDAAAAVASLVPVVNVVEFYNAPLDNYFITANANEAAAIDRGDAGPGWSRTGGNFKSGGSANVCRFYGSLSPGPNSHFYTVDPGECAGLRAAQALTLGTQKRWNFESLDFLSTPTVNGSCPAQLIPVYRAYNNGFARGVDSNHRITVSAAAIQEVVNRGWINEGVVMCAPK